MKPYEKLKSFNDCCIALQKPNMETEEKFNILWLKLSEEFGIELDTIYHEKLKIIVDAINLDEPFNPNIQDIDERKYYPYFVVDSEQQLKGASSGVGFSDSYYCCFYSGSSVGSRLCFPNSDKVLYAGKTFIKEYYDYHKLNKTTAKEKFTLPQIKIIITRNQMKEIFDIACSDWKFRIEKYTELYQKDMFSNEIILPQSIVKEMFEASNHEQLNVLNKIFNI
jgi:hypothetical protein